MRIAQRSLFWLGLYLIAVTLAFAALPSTTVWEVRPTVGSDTTAGGCFDSAKSGTDYSQQNSSQYNATDLVLVTTTTATSASHSFVSADVGNCIHITAGSGFTAGYYEIISAASGTATLDRAAGTASSTGGTYSVGGAAATVSNVNANWTASNQVWVKATGSYTVTSALTMTLDSHAAPGIPAAIIGYSSTRGDNGQFTWTTSTNSIDLIDFTEADNLVFQNIIFSSSAGTPGDGLQAKTSGPSQSIYVINCKLSGFLVGIEGNFTVNWSFNGLYFINSRATANTSHGIRNAGVTYVLGSMLDNNGGDGFNTATSGQTGEQAHWAFENSVIYKNSANGINVAFSNNGGTVVNLIVVNYCDISTNTDAGIVMSNVTNPLSLISNSIFDANGTYGIDSGSTSETLPLLLYDNAFYNNTTAATRGVNSGIGTITLTASPYTTIGSNFALNSTSGGGAALLNAGFPGTIPGAGTGHASVGALQPIVSGGGGQVGFPIVQ